MEGPARRHNGHSPDDDEEEQVEDEDQGAPPTQHGLARHVGAADRGLGFNAHVAVDASLDATPFDMDLHDAFAAHDYSHLHHHHHHQDQDQELQQRHHLQEQPLQPQGEPVEHQHHGGEDSDSLAVRYHHGHEQVARPSLPFVALDGHPAPSLLLGGHDELSLQHMLARHHFSHHHHHHQENGCSNSITSSSTSSDDSTGACPDAANAAADGEVPDEQQLHLLHYQHHQLYQQLPLALPMVVSSLLPQPPRGLTAVDSQAAFHHHQQSHLHEHCHRGGGGGGAEGDEGGDKRVDFRCTSSSEEKWERKFQELVEFKRLHHSFKPLKKTNRKLYWWVKDQRAFFREGRLPAHRMDKLLEAGLFAGDTRTVSAKWDDVWEERFSELLSFKEQHGHTFVPNKSNAALYAWVRSQRLAKSKGRLSDSRKRRLDEIEFCWTGKQGEAPRRSGGGGKRRKVEDASDEQSGPSPPPVISTTTLFPLPSQLLASLPTGVEGFDHHRHHLFLQQHAVFVQQLQLAVAQQEGLGLTLPPGLKVEKSEGEVKDFLDLLSSQNKLFDIAEATTAVLDVDDGASATTHESHHHYAPSQLSQNAIAAPAATMTTPVADDRPPSLRRPPTHHHHRHHHQQQQQPPTEGIAQMHHHHHF